MSVPLGNGGEKKFNWASELSTYTSPVNPVIHGVFFCSVCNFMCNFWRKIGGRPAAIRHWRGDLFSGGVAAALPPYTDPVAVFFIPAGLHHHVQV